jgi:hypothetical protein
MAVPILDGTPSYNVNQSGTTSLALNSGGTGVGHLTTAHGNGFCYVATLANGNHVTGITDGLSALAFSQVVILSTTSFAELWRARIPSGGITNDLITVAFGTGNTYATGMAWCVSDPAGGTLLVDADVSSTAAAEGFITTTSPNCFVSAYYDCSVTNPAAGAGMTPIVDSSISLLQFFGLTEYVTKASPGLQGMTFNVGDYANVGGFIAESVSLTGTVAAASNSLGIMGLSAAEW